MISRRKTHLLFCLLCACFLFGNGCSKARKTSALLTRAERHLQEGKKEAAKIELINVLRLDGTNAIAIRKLGQVFFSEGEFRSAFAFLNEAKKSSPEDTELRLMLAQIYQSGRQVKESHAEARAILEKSPTNDTAIVLLSTTLAKPEDLPDARKELAALKQKIGDRASFHLANGNLYLLDDKIAEAEAEYTQAEKIDPKFGLTYLAEANLYTARREIDKADHAFEMAAVACEDKSRVNLAWADFKLRTGKVPEAKNLIDQVRKSDPDYLPGLASAAELALQEKNYDSALDLAKQMLARDPKNYEARLLRARVHLAKNEPARSIEVLESMLEEYPKLPLLRYQCAQAYLLNNQIPKAVTSLNTAIVLNPDFVDAILLLAQIDLRKGEYPAAVSLLSDLTKRRPEVSQGYLLLGKAYEARKTPDDALNLYARYTGLFPKDANGPFLIGMLQANQYKNLAKARKAFENALQLAPDNLPVINQLIELDVKENKFQSALARAEELSTKFPKSATPALLIAKVYSSQQNLDQAEAALLRAIKIEPEASAPYLTLAQLYVSSKKQDQALAKLNDAVAKNPNDAEAWMLIGMVEDQRADRSKAAEAYRQVLKINPRFSAALNNLAYLDAEYLGMLDEAYDLARKARDFRPFDPYTADTFGWVLYRKGQYPQALELLKESAENLPGQPEVLFHLGMAHYALAEEAPARQAFEAALNAKGDFQFRAQVEERLAILNLNGAKADASAVKLLEAKLSQDPNDVVALVRLGDFFDKTGNIDRAVKTYELAQQKSPTVIPITLKLARLYSEKLQDSDRAIKLLKAARATAPDDPAVSQMLGHLAYQKGDVQWALDLLQENSQKANMPPEILVDLALAQYTVGRVGESEKTMRRALDAGGNFARSEEARRFLSMLDLYQHPADPRDAQAKANALLQANPKYLPALMLSAFSDERSNNPAKARQTYEAILKQNPQFAPAMKRLAFLSAGADDKKAFELGSKAKVMLPEDRDLPRFLGMTAFRLADYPTSIPFLSQSVSLAPNDADVLYHLGLAHYQLKHSKDSKDALRRALTLDQKNKLAPEAQQILAQLK
jgi:tetratricopeptide (TPR) repeat protein